MKYFVCGLAACVAVGLASLSPDMRADEPDKKVKADPAAEFAAIQKDWMSARQAYIQAVQRAKTPEERRQVMLEKQPKPAEFADRCMKLAEAYPENPVTVEALAWVVGNARGTPAYEKAIPTLKDKVAAITDLEQLQKILRVMPGRGLPELAPVVAEKAKKNLDHPQAVSLLIWVCSATLYGGPNEAAKLYNDTVDLLVDRFVERPELASLPDWLRRDDDPAWAEKHLRRLMEKNPSASIKAQSKFALASVLKNKDEASQGEAEKLFQSVINEIASLAKPGPVDNQKLELANKELEDLKLRGIGKPVPEIAGNDLDDKAFKLSDYKGKVVLLDFWGFW